MTRRALPNVAAQEIDNAMMEIREISKAAAKIAMGSPSREEILTHILRIVINAQNAERALRNAKAPKPE